jgi:hypothetical protein
MTLLVLASAVAFGVILSVASPAIVLLRRSRCSPSVVVWAQRWIFLSAFVVVVAAAIYCGVYFERGNYIVGSLAVAAGIVLAGFSFVHRPVALGIVAGTVGLLSWIVVGFAFTLGALSSDNSTRTFRMVDGTYCRGAMYGLVMTDSGLQVDIFGKYWIFEKINLTHQYSDLSPEDDSEAYPGKGLLKECASLYVGRPEGQLENKHVQKYQDPVQLRTAGNRR